MIDEDRILLKCFFHEFHRKTTTNKIDMNHFSSKSHFKSKKYIINPLFFLLLLFLRAIDRCSSSDLITKKKIYFFVLDSINPVSNIDGNR